jgi:hypothetical protein
VVVDVGDVAAYLDRLPGQPENPGGHVGPHERGGMTQVGGVVRGDAADVDASRAHQRQPGATDLHRSGPSKTAAVSQRSPLPLSNVIAFPSRRTYVKMISPPAAIS